MSLLGKYYKNKLFEALPEVFRCSNLYSLVHRRTAFRLLSQWKKKGRIKSVGKGIYAKLGEDSYYIATVVYNGYISFGSALYLLGLKTEIENRIIVVTAAKKKPMNISSVKIIPVEIKGFHIGSKFIKKGKHDIRVATLAKILFDMCHKPKYADFYSMYRAMNWRRFKKEDWKELFSYARMAPLSTIRRIGYITEGKAPEWFIKKLEKLNKPVGISFIYGKKGNYNKKWRIYDKKYVRKWIDEK